MDQPDVDVGQARLPGDRPLRLAQGRLLDRVDQLLELALGDRLVRPLALLVLAGREALDQLAGDPDDDLGRPEAGHLLGLLEGDRAVVDDGRDVGDRARLHVRQALALAADAADDADAARIDLEDERLGELGARRRAPCTRPAWARRRDPRSGAGRSPGSPGSGRTRRLADLARRRGRQAVAAGALALGHLRPSAAPAVERGARRAGRGSPAATPRSTRSSRDRHEELRLVRLEAKRDDAARQQAAQVPGNALHRLDRLERAAECDDGDAAPRPSTAARPARPALGIAAAGARPSRRRASLSSPGGRATRSGRASIAARRQPPALAGAASSRAVDPGVGAVAGERLDPAHARADAPLAGDHEAADLARRPAVGAAAQLVAVALDPDRAHRLAVLLVEERVRAGVDRLAPCSSTRPSPADPRG